MELKSDINILEYFSMSIFAGIMIAFGAIIYLRCPNNIVGSFMFSIGLLTIILFQGNLFTGKIGNARYTDVGYMIICLIGNYIGTWIISTIMKDTSIYQTFFLNVGTIVSNKLSSGYTSLFLLALMCGILMHIAVTSYKKRPDIVGVIMIFLCVSTFILCGFEHCIADMVYINLASTPLSINVITKLFIIILGNTLGAKIINLYIN